MYLSFFLYHFEAWCIWYQFKLTNQNSNYIGYILFLMECTHPLWILPIMHCYIEDPVIVQKWAYLNLISIKLLITTYFMISSYLGFFLNVPFVIKSQLNTQVTFTVELSTNRLFWPPLPTETHSKKSNSCTYAQIGLKMIGNDLSFI